MVAVEYTGNVRHRAQSRLFRKPILILQIERRHHGYDVGLDAEVDYRTWADAGLEDLETMRQQVEDRHRRAQESLLKAMRGCGVGQ